VLTCWSERATARSVVTGAMVGLGVFLGLTLAAATGATGPAEEWLSAVVSAPAALAVPAHLVAAWLLRSRGTPSPRHSLPPALEAASAPIPAGSHGG
jgi:Na+(H+)/acetate symporter ActP